MSFHALYVVALGLAVGLVSSSVGADEKAQLKPADFAGKWEGESKSKDIINVKLSLDANGKGVIRYRVVKGGEGGNDRDANAAAVLQEKGGKFSLSLEKMTWSASLGTDNTTLTLTAAKGGETITLKKTEK